MDNLSLEIIKAMPFRKEIVEWCNLHKTFQLALKVAYPRQFKTFFGISISSCSHYNNENIGIIVYDKKTKRLDQDFILDKEAFHKEFFLYTALPPEKKYLYGKYVNGIGAFYNLHKRHNCYKKSHHPKLNDLDPKLQERIRSILSTNEVMNIINPLKRQNVFDFNS